MRPSSHTSIEFDEMDMRVVSEKLSVNMENQTNKSKETRCPEQNIIRYVSESLHREDEFSFLRLEFLQRLNIVHHEVALVRMKSELQAAAQASPTQLERLAVVLRDYSIYLPIMRAVDGGLSARQSVTYTICSYSHPELPIYPSAHHSFRQNRQPRPKVPLKSLLYAADRRQRSLRRYLRPPFSVPPFDVIPRLPPGIPAP